MSNSRTPLMDISNNDLASSPAATGSRRKSGRAVKAPKKFVLDVPSSQQDTAGAKRKRGEDNGASDASDIDEESEDSDSSVASVAEEEIRQTQKKPARPRKPAAKKPKVNGNTLHEEAPAVKLPGQPKKAKRVAIADEDAEGLYADVFTSGESLEDVATQWLNKAKANSPEAMTDMINFILKCCGCDLQVEVDDINDPDNAQDRLAELQGEYQAQNITEYPLISKSKALHGFRSSLVGFVENLVMVLHQSEVFYEEPELFENINHWLAPMTSAKSRPFRHTATLIALTITSSLCRVANLQTEQAAKLQRQLDGEQKKKGHNKARLADFRTKIATNESNKEFVQGHIMDFYSTIYTHRYRDVDPKIRLECVEALGDWILTLADTFFEGEYLRYMGWMLSDVHGPMRHLVVKQLQKIIKSLNIGTIGHFIERFRPRIIEIATRDSEPGVRASAVELVDLIRETGMIEPDDIDTIGKLIFDTEPRVRKAVVPFFTAIINDLYDSIIEEIGEEALEDMPAVEEEDDSDRPRPVWIRYKCLTECLLNYDSQDQDDVPSQIDSVDFLSTSGTESRFTLAGQALYEKLPGLKEWEVLAGYLLYDHTSNTVGTQEVNDTLRASFRPNEKEELILLEVLNAVVKMNLTQLEDSHNTKKKPPKAEIAEAKEVTARKLASLIPRLLKKYGSDPKTATVVLRLEHVLNLGVFQQLRQDSTVYAKLLDEISAQFNGHVDKHVLVEAGAAFLHARSYEELEEVTESKMSTLWDDTISTLRKINKAGEISVRGGFREKVLRELSHNLSRLQQLASISDCIESLEADDGSGNQTPISILIDIVARGQFAESIDETIDSLEDEIVVSAIRSGLFYFMWKVRYITTAIKVEDEIQDAFVDELRDLQDTFINNIIASFTSRASLDPVRLLGAGTCLDLHILFAGLRSASDHNAAGLGFGVDEHLQSLVAEVPYEVYADLTLVFDSLEKQFAKKSRKKLADPGDDDPPEDVDSESDDEDDTSDSERQAEILKAEQQLCEFTGKLVLAILAKVIDVSGPLKGKLRTRIQRNRLRLGPNFKEVVAYLDEPKPKAKKSQKSKALPAASAQEKAAKSAEVIEHEDEDSADTPLTDIEPEEGDADDLRRLELLDDDAIENHEEEDVTGPPEDHDEDEVMGN